MIADTVGVNTKNGAITTSKDSSVTTKVKYEYPALKSSDIIVIPADTELVVELLNEISTETSREGDKFTARIVSPSEISGAIIEGRVDKMRRPGRIKRRAEILLSFDRIILTEQRWSNFNAIVTDVLPSKGDNVKRVDSEGIVEGDRPYKDDANKDRRCNRNRFDRRRDRCRTGRSWSRRGGWSSFRRWRSCHRSRRAYQSSSESADSDQGFVRNSDQVKFKLRAQDLTEMVAQFSPRNQPEPFFSF